VMALKKQKFDVEGEIERLGSMIGRYFRYEGPVARGSGGNKGNIS